MNSSPPHLDPLSSASAASTARRRGSTSQMCLQRILTTIATVPPPPLPAAEPSLLAAEAEEANAAYDVSNFSRFDLDLTEAKKSLSSTSSGGCGCDVDRDERSLSLLIEAAKLIFGEFVEEEKSELEKDHAAAAVEIGGAYGEAPPSPVVRSKRGRTRVMPCRYRDSVLEPLPRFSRTGSTAVSAKRRRG